MGTHYDWCGCGMWNFCLEGIQVWMVGEVGVGFYNGNPLLLVWMWNVDILSGGD